MALQAIILGLQACKACNPRMLSCERWAKAHLSQDGYILKEWAKAHSFRMWLLKGERAKALSPLSISQEGLA